MGWMICSPPGIQIQGRIHQCNGAADTVIPILVSNLVQRPVDVGPARGFLHLREQGQLHQTVHWRCLVVYGKWPEFDSQRKNIQSEIECWGKQASLLNFSVDNEDHYRFGY